MRSATTLAIADSICRTLGNGQTAGRLSAMRFPAGGNLWRTQRYYPWSARRNRGMLAGLKVGYDEGTDERLSRGYAYNGFGDITALTEGADSYAFSYDGLGRLTSAYGYDSVRQLLGGLSDDCELYNHGRPHQSAAYLTPVGERCVLRWRQTARCRS